MVMVLREAPGDTALLAREWSLTAVRRHIVDAGGDVAVGSEGLWLLVITGSARVHLDAGASHRVRAHAASEIAVGDLSPLMGTLPPSIVVRDFATRQVALRQLIDTCPLGDACASPIWTRAYANILGASMLTAWIEDRGRTPTNDPAVAAVLEALTRAPGERWSLDRMARLAHLSRSALTARFRAALGSAPSDVLRDLRMTEARELLARQQHPIGAVALAVGYGSTAAFSRAFSSHHGIAPQAWREGRRPAAVS